MENDFELSMYTLIRFKLVPKNVHCRNDKMDHFIILCFFYTYCLIVGPFLYMSKCKTQIET